MGMDGFCARRRCFLRSMAVIAMALYLSAPHAARAGEKQDGQQVDYLDEVVVTATKTPHTLKDVPVQTFVLTKDDIQRSNAQNIMALLKDIPGIHMADHGDVFGTYTWRAKLNGLDFNNGYGLILIDGQRAMGCGQSGGMGEYGIGLNQLPVSMIERVEVVTGSGSALYGSDAMAGVINIITRKPPRDGAGWAGAAYGWYDVRRQKTDDSKEDVPGERNQSQVYVGYGDRVRETIGYLLHYTYEGADDIGQNPLTSRRDAFLGKLDVTLEPALYLFAKLELGQYDKQDNRDEESRRVALGGDWTIHPRHLLAVKGYAYKWDFTHGTAGSPHGYKDGGIGYNQVELQYTWLLNDANTLVVGGEVQEQTIDYTIDNFDGAGVLSEVTTVDETVRTNSLFAQNEMVFSDKLTLIAGARYDNHSVFGDEINPKLSLMYSLIEDLTFRASVGRSFKSPTIRQLYYDAPYRHGDWYATSNPDLNPEIGLGYSAGFEYRFAENRWMVNLSYFRNDVSDMVVSVDTGDTYNGLPLTRYENVESAWTQGVTLLCKARPTRQSHVALSYTYTQTGNDETDKALTYVPDHLISLSPGYEWRSIALGVNLTATYTGRQYTDAGNKKQIDAHASIDAKLYKHLSDRAKLSFEVDDVFDSKKGREGSYLNGRAVTVKIDIDF